MMFIVVMNDVDKELLIAKGYKLIHEDFVNGTKRFIFCNNGERVNFAKENIHAFTTNRLYL